MQFAANLIALAADESPVSFCSRMALVVGRTARDFCLDMGFRFEGIVNGDPTTLEAFALSTGVEAKSLIASAIVKDRNRRHSVGGQELIQETLSRQSLRVCPHCLLRDLEIGKGPVSARVYGRSSWLIAPIRTCFDHGSGLVDVLTEGRKNQMHDFARLIQPHLANLENYANAAVRRDASGLEWYLKDRLSGTNVREFWLDDLPFYAAVRTCEVLGLVSLYGARFRARGLTDPELHKAGAHGFEIASRGEVGIRNLLLELTKRFTVSRKTWGPKFVFGRLYEWLAHESSDPAYDPLRKIIRQHVVETMPVGPGDEIFGEPVTVRRLHSVRSASLETGAHRKRLRKLLYAAGYISEEALALTDDRITFQASEVHEFLEQASDSMTLKEAGIYINTPRPHERLLLNDDFIRPLVRGGSHALKDHAFARRDVEEFRNRLLADAAELVSQDNDLLPILGAATRTCSSASEIVALILNKKLSRVFRRTDVSGFLSVLVDPVEIRSVLYSDELIGYSLREVEGALRSNTRVVKALIDHGYLPSRIVRNPITKCKQTIVEKAELVEFQSRYVSLHVAAKERGMHILKMQSLLVAGSIQPAFKPEDVHASFYEREHIAHASFKTVA